MCYDQGTLQAYIDGELSELEMRHVEEHVAECKSCGLTIQQLKDSAFFVDAKVGAYVNAVEPLYDTQTAWERFAREKARRLRLRAVGFAGSRRFQVAAVAASLIFIFLVGSSLLNYWAGPEQTAKGPAAITEQLGSSKGKTGIGVKKPVNAGGSLKTEKSPAGAVEEARSRAVRPAAPVAPATPADSGESQRNRSPDVEAVPPAQNKSPEGLLGTFSVSMNLPVPIDLRQVKEVSVVLGDRPRTVRTGEEREKVIGWYNKGIPTGWVRNRAEVKGTLDTAVLKVVLFDGTEINVGYVDDSLVQVYYLENVYHLRAPELAAFMKKEGGERSEGVSN